MNETNIAMLSVSFGHTLAFASAGNYQEDAYEASSRRFINRIVHAIAGLARAWLGGSNA